MAGVASRVDRFSGFSDEAIQFFLELQAEQSRTWFKAHQDDYARLCRRPLELLVFELQERLVDVYPALSEVEPHFFRIQRDTRFSKDKAPYKTNVAADLPIRPRREGEDQHTTPGLYLSFGLDGEFVAIGAWHMSPAVLARYRGLLDDRRRGAEIKSIADRLQGEGWELGSMEKLKRVRRRTARTTRARTCSSTRGWPCRSSLRRASAPPPPSRIGQSLTSAPRRPWFTGWIGI